MQRQICKDVRRAWDWDRCLQDVCQEIQFSENFPIEVANICTETFQSCATAGNIMESSLLLERLCRINWMDPFPSLFQSKLTKLMWCCCPVFTAITGRSICVKHQHYTEVVCVCTCVCTHKSATVEGTEDGNPKSKFLYPTVHIPTVHKKTGRQQ